jgi:hypothetical protein
LYGGNLESPWIDGELVEFDGEKAVVRGFLMEDSNSYAIELEELKSTRIRAHCRLMIIFFGSRLPLPSGNRLWLSPMACSRLVD